jgi:hypothetical protein
MWSISALIGFGLSEIRIAGKLDGEVDSCPTIYTVKSIPTKGLIASRYFLCG